MTASTARIQYTPSQSFEDALELMQERSVKYTGARVTRTEALNTFVRLGIESWLIVMKRADEQIAQTMKDINQVEELMKRNNT